MKEKTCLNCGKKYLVKRHRENEAKYCSRVCSGIYRRGLIFPNRGKKIEKTCLQCGKIYMTREQKGKNRKFCSIECYRLYDKNHRQCKKVEKECLQCGKKYEVFKHYENISKYCSRKCNGLSRITKIEKVCIICGKTFKVQKSYALNRKFCSHKCQALNVKGKFFRERICLTCGKPYKDRNSKVRARKYCSRNCYFTGLIFKERIQKMLLNYSPNKSEIKLNNIIQELNLPYKFVGNGEVWIAGLNPDFINTNSQKKIIELFGEVWHGKGSTNWIKPEYIRTEKGRKDIFSKYGYDTLIIWEKELNNIDVIKNKILAFEQISHT